MTFETGKKYEFKRNEFDISKESGKLYFVIKDPAADLFYRIRPFDFQTRELPEKIVCYVSASGRLSQDVYSVAPILYSVGDKYVFRVMKQDYKSLRCTLRDDVNGVEFANIDLGSRKRVERFHRVTCEILDVENGRFKLRMVDGDSAGAGGFAMSDLGAIPEAVPFLRSGVVGRVLAEETFVDARTMMEGGELRWPVAALETAAKYLPKWIESLSPAKKRTLLRLKALAIGLIERSTYLARIPIEERRLQQERLSAIVHTIDDYLRVTELMAGGEDEAMIQRTLSSLKTSGWLYEPEKKMRLLMAIFTLRNAYAQAYIGEIFSIIREHHADPNFMNTFRQGFITMLDIYIDNESKVLDPVNRDGLRELVMALALQLLLTANMEFERWNEYRGLLYTCASLLVNRYDFILPAKALQSYADRIDAPLEFSWRDLDDVSLMCYNRLCARLPVQPASSSEISVFEQQNARLEISSNEVRLMPAVSGALTRTALTRQLFPSMDFRVSLDSRLTEGSTSADASPTLQLPMWKQLEIMLFDPSQRAQARLQTAAVVARKTLPEVGDEVTLRITGKDENEYHTFFCTIEDDLHYGCGTIITHEIVGYPVRASVQTFEKDGKPLLLQAVVTGQNPDGSFVFSMRRGINQYFAQKANEDCANGSTLQVIVSADDAGKKYYGVSDLGYPVVIWTKRDMPQLAKYDVVYVNVDNVSLQGDVLFVNTLFSDIAPEEEQADNGQLAISDSFHMMLVDYAREKVYEPAETDDAAAEAPAYAEDIAENYLSPSSVSAISQLLNAMAISEGDNLPRAYSLLSVSLIMARMAGDMYRATFLHAKCALLEALAKFAGDGRIDPAEAERLSDSCRRFVSDDADLAQKLEVVRTLSRLDQPGEVPMPGQADMSPAAKVARLVNAYNQLRGLRMNVAREEIIKGIYGVLRLPVPESVDVLRIKAQEDQHNEFKESMIYPAGNGMHASEMLQGREIMEVVDGMLNSEGGTLYIGVNNQGIPSGLANDFIYLNRGHADYDVLDMQDKFSLAFYANLREQIGLTYGGKPMRDYVTLEFDDLGEKVIARVSVRPFPGMVRMKDDKVFLRQDSSTLPIRTAREQKEFEKNRQV